MAEMSHPDIAAVDLRSLVDHAAAVAAATTVERVQQEFARTGVAFLAVLDGDQLLGVCARRELDQALGSRFGFALNAGRPVREHLMAAPLRFATGTPLTEVFKAAAERDRTSFFDDVLLVAPDGAYLGLIAMRTLVRLQTDILLGNIDRLEASRRDIAAKNREMESDLAMAREVQLALLPATTAPISAGGRTLRLAHHYQPAGIVSGDFFDVMRLSEETFAIAVCDVMGHGVRAALITAMVRAMLEELRPMGGEPGALLTRLNRDLTGILRQTGDLIFVTMAYAVLAPAAGRIRYAQAGHPAPLHWDARAGKTRPVACAADCAGPALGLVEDVAYGTSEEAFQPGDRLVLFTDGVFEAVGVDGEEFGRDRLADAVSASACQPLGEALTQVLAGVAAFGGGAPFADDICLIAVEWVQAATGMNSGESGSPPPARG
jgi:serine phosphatase RsbU (regulator of sigma subunit)